MDFQEVFALIFTLGMFAGVFIIFLGLRQRSLQLEMQHRERMAMIERGQVPQSEILPRSSAQGGRQTGSRGLRSMTVGIVICAVGLGLMSIISIASEAPQIGIGIGGAIVIVGLAFIVVSVVTRNMTAQEEVSTTYQPATYQPPRIPKEPDRVD